MVMTNAKERGGNGKMDQRLLIRSMCYQMHPDLFEKTPQVDFALRIFDERDKNMAISEFWMDWVTAGLDAPYDPHGAMLSMNEWNTMDDEWKIDSEKVIKKLSQAIKWAVSKGYSVAKSYESDYFKVFIKPNSRLEITLIADRQSVCVAVPTGNKKIIPATAEKIVDEVEWICEKISFLGVE